MLLSNLMNFSSALLPETSSGSSLRSDLFRNLCNTKSSLLYVASTFTHQYVSFHTQQAGLVQFAGKRSNSVITLLIIVLYLLCFLEYSLIC